MLYRKMDGDQWSRGQKYLFSLSIVLALGAFAAGMVIRNSVPENGLFWMTDFKVYFTGGLAILHGNPLYAVTSGPFNLQFTYSPFAAILFTPFALIPEGLGEILWALLNIFALVAVSWMSLDMMHIPSDRRRCLIAFIIGLASIVLDGVLTNFVFGQINAILMLFVFLDVQKKMPEKMVRDRNRHSSKYQIGSTYFYCLFILNRSAAWCDTSSNSCLDYISIRINYFTKGLSAILVCRNFY